MPQETQAMAWLRNTIMGRPARIEQVRRFLLLYDAAAHGNIQPNLAFGVQFPNGRCVLWQAQSGYVDQHRDIAALEALYAEHGNVSIRFIDDEVKP